MKDTKYGIEVSPSLSCELYCHIASVPMCNACKKWVASTMECSRYPKGIPRGIRFLEYHECREFDLDPNDPNLDLVEAQIAKEKKKQE